MAFLAQKGQFLGRKSERLISGGVGANGFLVLIIDEKEVENYYF